MAWTTWSSSWTTRSMPSSFRTTWMATWRSFPFILFAFVLFVGCTRQFCSNSSMSKNDPVDGGVGVVNDAPERSGALENVGTGGVFKLGADDIRGGGGIVRYRERERNKHKRLYIIVCIVVYLIHNCNEREEVCAIIPLGIAGCHPTTTAHNKSFTSQPQKGDALDLSFDQTGYMSRIFLLASVT